MVNAKDITVERDEYSKMAVRTQCPRCKQPLSVPNKLAGSYASCPRCQGRFWVSKDAPLDPSVTDSGGLPVPSGLTLTQAPVATPPGRAVPSPLSPVSGPAVPPRQYFPSVTPLAPSGGAAASRLSINGAAADVPQVAASLAPPVPVVPAAPAAPPVAPPQTRKVARLVSADAAQSTLKLAADGQLPQLQLQEIDKKDKAQGKSRSISPLVMILAWIFSVAVTVAVVMISSDDDSSSATSQAKKEAIAKIEDPQFFGNPARHELLPYQRLLREACQARARKDFKAERLYYKQVLDLLHTETWDGASARAAQNHLEKGITGSRDHDRELEQLILTVLGE